MAKKLFRKRKKSMKTVLGITSAKRKIARATGIPTTKTGRKRKMLNVATGGAYGRYQRTRAKVNRPFKAAKRITSGKHSKRGCLGCGGCLVQVLAVVIVTILAATATITALM